MIERKVNNNCINFMEKENYNNTNNNYNMGKRMIVGKQPKMKEKKKKIDECRKTNNFH